MKNVYDGTAYAETVAALKEKLAALRVKYKGSQALSETCTE